MKALLVACGEEEQVRVVFVWALFSPAIPAFIQQDRALRSVLGVSYAFRLVQGESFRKVLESLTAYLGEVYIHVHIHRLSWTCICKFTSLACWKTSSFDRSNWQVICQRTSCASNLWWRQTMPPIPSDPTLRKLTSPQVKIVQSGHACFLHVLDSCIFRSTFIQWTWLPFPTKQVTQISSVPVL